MQVRPSRLEIREAIVEADLTAKVLRTSAERVIASREAIRQSDGLFSTKIRSVRCEVASYHMIPDSGILAPLVRA